MFRNALDIAKVQSDFGHDYVRRFQNIQKWMQKTYQDSYDRYMFRWIAFNIFYNLNYQKRFPNKSLFKTSEGNRIKGVLKKLPDRGVSLIKKIIQENPDYLDFLIRIFNLDNLHQEVKSLVCQNEYKKAILKFLELLYKIRCDLMHGDKDPTDEDVSKLLEDSSKILETVMAVLLEPYFPANITP